KRNFLTLALVGAFAMVLAGSAWSSAGVTCAPGTVSYLPIGNYAFLMTGAVTDTTGTGADPWPLPIAAIGVFHSTGACTIDTGEMIEDSGGTFSGPAVIIPSVPPV